MKALLLKDCYVIGKKLKIFLLIIPFIAISTGGNMSAFAIFLGAALPMTAIAYDEHSKWNQFAIMMPYTKFQLIFSKYLLSYISIMIAAILSIIGSKIGVILKLGDFHNGLQITSLAIAGALVFIAINTPIFFKFGSEKGRFVFLGVMAIMGAIGPLFRGVDKDIIIKILDISPLWLIVLAIICNIISIFISMNINQKNA